MQARALAAVVVDQTLTQGRSLSDTLPVAVQRLKDVSQSALLKELCFGTLRWAPQLDYYAHSLLRKPLKHKDSDVFALLLVGLYQLNHMRVAPHVAVSQSVAAVVELNKEWAKGLVNAVLRGYQRNMTALQAADATDSATYAHPDWLLQRFKKDWPEDWRALAEANNARAPMSLRVNRQKISRTDYAVLLQAAKLNARENSFAPDALLLETPVDVFQLPAFEQGFVSVQDIAAQLAAALLDPQPGERILDACAAPGGKTAHLLEYQPKLAELVAMDSDAQRMVRVRDNLQRLQLSAHLVVADAAELQGEWDGRLFDRILLDAPCSATGVIRRHPDIKVLRRAADIDAVVAQQARLLTALWPTLRPGGVLLYATCSVLRDENDLQVSRFISAHPDAECLAINTAWGRTYGVGRQILPGDADMDGFYYACIRKH